MGGEEIGDTLTVACVPGWIENEEHSAVKLTLEQ